MHPMNPGHPTRSINPIVRAAAAADATAIAAVGTCSFTWAFGHLFTADVLNRYLERTYSADKIRLSLGKPENLFFVVEAHGCVRGFLKLKRDCPHPALAGRQWQLQKLYVDPEFIRGGLGAALMAAGEQAMRGTRESQHSEGSEGAELVWLLVYTGNERALAFYDRFGYLAAGRETHAFEHIRVDFRLLAKRLPARSV